MCVIPHIKKTIYGEFHKYYIFTLFKTLYWWTDDLLRPKPVAVFNKRHTVELDGMLIYPLLMERTNYIQSKSTWTQGRVPSRNHKALFLGNILGLQTFYCSCNHLVVCLTTGPKPLPKRAVHTVRSRASFFGYEYPLFSLRSSRSFLRLLPRLPVTSIPPFIFPSITYRRRQLLRKMWPIQLAFRLLISCRIISIKE
jgi:hypothetical protein